MDDTHERFARFADDYIRWEDVPAERRLHERPDIHVFIVLAELDHGTRHMVASAHHDEFFLDADPRKVMPILSDDTLRDLIRAGLRYDATHESFCMFA